MHVMLIRREVLKVIRSENAIVNIQTVAVSRILNCVINRSKDFQFSSN